MQLAVVSDYLRQVAPANIDNLILRCKDVEQVGVAGVPATTFGNPDSTGSVPRAFAVKRPGSTLTEEDLVRFVQGKHKTTFDFFSFFHFILFIVKVNDATHIHGRTCRLNRLPPVWWG
jgi:acyl-CoA synthetase (AMP-forming)/AMP-acid ligase II